uniref:SCP domain-containing protein n=1 Tax=Mesocestoides corti TaxID=53468 RepID=A0A5K3FV30_MESCO
MRSFVCLLALIGHAFTEIPPLNEQNVVEGVLAQVRGDVKPPASNMNLVRYSLEMEALAVDWVSYCSNEYPNVTEYPQFEGTGIAMQSFHGKKPRFLDVLDFATNSSKYNYFHNTCDGVCKNYKLVSSALYFKNVAIRSS